MRIELAQGVGLTVVPTKKFKTTRVAIHFLAPLAQVNVAARTLLTSVLETSSADYATQAEMSAYLETLFGASFGIGVGKEGQWHRVTAGLTLLNDQFAQEALLQQGFAFLNQVLHRPLMHAGQFDEAVFKRERHNLQLYLESLSEDRQTQASLALQALYFDDDPAQATPSFGTPAGLASVTPAGLVTAYQQLLSSDRIEIVVLGDVQPDAVEALAQTLAFAPRVVPAVALAVKGAPRAQRTQVETVPVNQAKLNLGYRTDFDLYTPAHYAAIVANDLFGGSPLSLLFTNVREKASLAYYASSSLDAMRQVLMVQTGIDAESAAKVTQLIAQQLEAVQAGEFTTDKLRVIQDGLVSNRETAYDSPRFLARQALLRALLASQPTNLAQYTAGIRAVTKAQVMAAAATFKLEAQYLLTEKTKGL
ncbi:MAG: insulinase family protein [Lactobacillus sp.]|jgi:predicted Zn-dependent peptidase|nr:insulinase family protein [Lactobacillus sp.]MCI2034096.1 insulinase family protein [Lactobacillus sp.]